MILKVSKILLMHTCFIPTYVRICMIVGAAEGSILALHDLDHCKSEKSSQPTVTPHMSRYSIHAYTIRKYVRI